MFSHKHQTLNYIKTTGHGMLVNQFVYIPVVNRIKKLIQLNSLRVPPHYKLF